MTTRQLKTFKKRKTLKNNEVNDEEVQMIRNEEVIDYTVIRVGSMKSKVGNIKSIEFQTNGV